jgi:citrate lyase subunit beta / citryl-CoA lyase
MDPLSLPARSWLFVPATRQERFAKAAASGADRVILDLEDSVAPPEKREAARALSGASLPANVPVYLRVNGHGTEWFQDDLAVAARLPVAGIVLPKAEAGEHVARAAAALPAAHRIVPIVETAVGLWNVLDVARAPRVERVAFGAVDFELDTGMRDEGDSMAYARSRVAVASRVAGVAPPIDSVSLGIDDEAAVARDAERGRRLGFAGKLCIHPRQVGPTNRVFQPGEADVEWAESLLAALAARPGDAAAFSFRGTMVDRPVIERARQILAQAGKAPAGGGAR